MIDWIKVRGVRWVRLETDAIEFEEGMHEFRSANFGWKRGLPKAVRTSSRTGRSQ